MSLRDLASAALAAQPATSRNNAHALLEGAYEGSVTFRLEEGGQGYTVVWEFDGLSSRLACTCGRVGCEHISALLVALAEDGLVTPERPSAPASPAPASEAITAGDDDLADAAEELIRQTCAEGLSRDASRRDQALDRLLDMLRDRDKPDLKRAVALLRRVLTAPDPSSSRAVSALLHLASQAASLRELSRTAESSKDHLFRRREEVRLLEVARDTQRTPFGERRDISYFLDLDEHHLLREVATSKPGSPPKMSEGPFPKFLIGNLVTVEAGPAPQHLKLLQYASAGYPADADLDRLMTSSLSSVSRLYREHRRLTEATHRAMDELIIFAPEHVLQTATGVILADENMELLPLARAVAPALCSAVDLLARRGTLLAVIGPPILTPTMLTLLPLSTVIEIDGDRTLRRLR